MFVSWLYLFLSVSPKLKQQQQYSKYNCADQGAYNIPCGHHLVECHTADHIKDNFKDYPDDKCYDNKDYTFFCEYFHNGQVLSGYSNRYKHRYSYNSYCKY